MRPDEAIKRLQAWHAEKPLPAYSTRHFAIADNENLLVVAFVRMGGESAPWGIAWGHAGESPRILTVPEARNREAVAGLVAEFATSLLEHFVSPLTHDWAGATERDTSISLRQVWMPNASHVAMLHFLAYTYTFTKYGDRERYTVLNALGRLAGWLFREHDRPGQMAVMAATDALRSTYVFPAEDVRQAHLGYLMAWLETRGGREKRLAAAQLAEERSISITLDPSVERDELEPLVATWNDKTGSSRAQNAAKAEIDEILGRELRARFDLVVRTIQHIRAHGPRVNTGVARLTDATMGEHWYQYVRMELRHNDSDDGIAFTPSPETDRNPAAAASRYLIQQASEEFHLSVLIHDDEELQHVALMRGDGIKGRCIDVSDVSAGRSIQAVWTLDVPELAPLRIREGSRLCRVGAPKRDLQVQSVTRKDANTVRIKLLVTGAKKPYSDDAGRSHPIASSREYEGQEMTLVPVSMDQLSRLKNKKIWGTAGPGAWITHAAPAGPKTRLPKDVAGGDGNLFEQLGKL